MRARKLSDVSPKKRARSRCSTSARCSCSSERRTMNKRGMLTLEQLKGMVTKGEIETVLAGFTDHYGRLMGKRFDAEMFVEDVTRDGGHACNYVLTVDMEMEPVPG